MVGIADPNNDVLPIRVRDFVQTATQLFQDQKLCDRELVCIGNDHLNIDLLHLLFYLIDDLK